MKYDTLSDALKALKELEGRNAALQHAMGVLMYDGDTIAPSGSAEGRARTMGVMSGMEYALITDPANLALLEYLEANADALDAVQRRKVQLLRKSINRISRIPAEEYSQYAALTAQASAVWHRAKVENDFAAFAPWLEQIVDYNRRFAGYYDATKAPYDALLNEFEEGITTQVLDAFFARLKEAIVPLLAKVSARPQIENAFVHKHYPAAGQKEFSEKIMALMGIDPARCILGETEHPFTSGFNTNDVRITTHYYENDLLSSMYSVLHEGGHAIYEMGYAEEYNYTLLAGGASMGMHESQSRFYENIVGRSRAMSGQLLKLAKQTFPEQLEGVTERDFWLASNRAEPSLIRVDADELTYCLHIMVRYELEKQLIGGTLQVRDVPAAWNDLYEAYLGVRPVNDTEGCLQDSHWSGGMFGYFPSYALGSAYGAQMLAVLEREVPDVWQKVEQGDLSPVTGWLREHIHQYGCLFPPAELLKNACGEFDAGYYIDYLTRKFTAVYDL